MALYFNNTTMRKFFTLFALCLFTGIFAQHKVAQKIAEYKSSNAKFTHFSVLSVVNDTPSREIARAVDNATFAHIRTEAVNDIAANKYQTIEVEVPYNGNVILVELYKVNLFDPNFHLDTDKSKNIGYNPGVYYRGIIKGDENSVASFSFFNNEMNGVVSGDDLNNLVIGKLDKANNVSDYIVYSDIKMRVPNGFNCSVTEDTPYNEPQSHGESREALTNRWVTMYFEIDYNLYLQNNSNTTTTTNWMTSVFNNVQTLYENDGITVSLKSLYIWTDQDPYEGIGTSSSEYLAMFTTVRPVFDGDVGQLVGVDEGGLGGLAATINGLCSQAGYSYSDVNFSFSSVPTFSWTVQVITHEMGHLLGSRHTHACVWNNNNTSIDGCGTQAGYIEGSCAVGPIPTPGVKGTIMSYCHLISGVGISFNNGFGPQPTAAITNTVEGSGCLSTDGINTCINGVTDITYTNITNTSATISWTDIGNATSWQITVMPYNSTVTNWITVTSPTFNTTSPLNPNGYYKVRIRPVCDGVVPYYRQGIFATSANWCSGTVITDTGGAANNYPDMQSYVRTLIPNLPQKKIRLDFTQFDLEQDYDYLYIYDGSDTAAPDLSGGGFTGDFAPTTIISSAADGSLTLKFYSDQEVNGEGFSANVVCEQNLGVEGYTPDIDFTYYPNPASGFVNIVSHTAISEILIYNPQGRLLYQSKDAGFEKKVDISAFATGTYFFKLKFEGKEANFKILKK